MRLLEYSNKKKKNSQKKIDKIDLVYTYVDLNDNKFLNILKKYKPINDIDKTRFEQYGEIYFSLKTIEKFASNIINNIFIVTFNQKLDEKKLTNWQKNKIKYINHDQIIPKKYLPTFNSITIESFLHNIPNITENFLYFNDDLFMGNYLKMKDIMTENNVPIIYIKRLDKPLKITNNQPWLNYYENGKKIFQNKFNIYPNIKPAHLPIMYNKTLSNYVWKIFENDLDKSMSRLRENKNINFWFLCYLVGLYDDTFKYLYATDKISIYLHCNLDTQEDIKKAIEYVKNIYIKNPLFFNINNINKKCLPIWDFIKDKYFLKFK